MNVCLVAREYPPETGGGGVGTYTYHLGHGLKSHGHQVTVISSGNGPQNQHWDDGVEVWRIPHPAPSPWARRLKAITHGRGYSSLWMRSRAVFDRIQSLEAERNPFDVIETPLWDAEGAAYSARYTRAPMVVRLQTPIFVSAAMAPTPTRRAAQRLERMALRKAVLVAAISRSNSALVATVYGIDPAKIRQAPLGINLPELSQPLVCPDSYKLLYVGRLEQRKGIRELIDALPRILGQDQRITVDIVGRDTGQEPRFGSYRAYFEHTVPPDLQSRVRFHGFVPGEELQHFYRDCDVFIAPSRYESFGLIYLEAMAYGKPVIGTRTGGIPEVVTDDVGRLVAAEDPDQIAAAVLALMNDGALRRTLGSNAFHRVRQHFSVEAMVQQTVALYDEAIGLHRRAPSQ